MIGLGIIGLGRTWEASAGPALRRVGDRCEVVRVHDAIPQRARPVARDFGAVACDGILRTVNDPRVDAAIVHDPAALGHVGVRLAASAGKPVLATIPFCEDAAFLRRMAEEADALGGVVVPALEWRYAPVTARLRELAATTLGRPREITVAAEVTKWEHWNALVDWCGFVGQATPSSLEVLAPPSDEETPPRDVRLVLLTGERRRVTVRLTTGSDAPTEVRCERGRATVSFPDGIVWRAGEGERTTEHLDHERPSFDVMLDQFLRRVVGGLVPVPSLEDVVRSVAVAAAIRANAAVGETIAIEM